MKQHAHLLPTFVQSVLYFQITMNMKIYELILFFIAAVFFIFMGRKGVLEG